MKLLPYILSPVRVLDITLTSEGHTIAAWRCPRTGAPQRTEFDAAAAAKGVVAVTVSGHGTVSKPAASEIAARIEAEADTFLATRADDCIAFVRRERLQPILDELGAANIHPQRITVGLTPEAAAREFYDGLRWRVLVRPTAEGSALAQAAVRRAALPLLGLLLCLLAANAAVALTVGTRRQRLRMELAARERTASTAADATTRQRALLAEFSAPAALSRAVVCDRIAAAVPDKVTLTQLAIEPLTKRFEAERPLQRREHTAVVGGTAPAAGDISAFVERLTEERCCRAVRLTHVERERDAERLVFRIEIGL